MPKLDHQGRLLDDKGNIIKDPETGNAYVVDDSMPKEQFTRKVQEIKAEAEMKAAERERAIKQKADEDTNRLIAQLEELRDGTVDKAKAQEYQAKIKELEDSLHDSAKAAQDRERKAREEAARETASVKAQLTRTQQQLADTQFLHEVQAAAYQPDVRTEFIRAEDLAALCRATLEQRAIVDDDGQPTGKYEFLVTVQVPDDVTGQKRSKQCSIKEAAYHFGQEFSHYLRPRGPAGMATDNRRGANPGAQAQRGAQAPQSPRGGDDIRSLVTEALADPHAVGRTVGERTGQSPPSPYDHRR